MKHTNIFEWIRVDEFSATPKYLQLTNSVLKAIEAGKIRKNDLMPSINELSFELEISRDTAEKGYKYLKKMGVLGSVPERRWMAGVCCVGASGDGSTRSSDELARNGACVAVFPVAGCSAIARSRTAPCVSVTSSICLLIPGPNGEGDGAWIVVAGNPAPRRARLTRKLLIALPPA